jgi:hypothetical protein
MQPDTFYRPDYARARMRDARRAMEHRHATQKTLRNMEARLTKLEAPRAKDEPSWRGYYGNGGRGHRIV